jgi:hypothetical protein
MLSLHFLNLRLLALTLFTFSLLCAHASAQGGKVKGTTTPAAPSVAVSLTHAGVRFVALSPVRKVRLEVLAADGSPAFDSGFRPGSVYDWRASGGALPTARTSSSSPSWTCRAASA